MITRLFKPPAISSKSITDLKVRHRQFYINNINWVDNQVITKHETLENNKEDSNKRGISNSNILDIVSEAFD